jgi:predicted transcriptional regulator
MARAKQVERENLISVGDEEDDKTLAAIDEGIRDAKLGRSIPANEVRKLVPKWTTVSTTRKKR